MQLYGSSSHWDLLFVAEMLSTSEYVPAYILSGAQHLSHTHAVNFGGFSSIQLACHVDARKTPCITFNMQFVTCNM